MAGHMAGSDMPNQQDLSRDITIDGGDNTRREEAQNSLDKVMADMANPLIYEPAQQSPLAHSTPREYSLTKTLTLAQRDECLAQGRQVMRDRARYYGHIQEKTTAGFQAEDLISHGALGSPDCASSSLEDIVLIHPLFRLQNFHDCTAEIYQAMTPALQLASLFLTTSACLQLQSTILYGQGENSGLFSFGRQGDYERIKEPCQVTPERYDAIQKYYWELADHVRFYFSTTLQPDSWACTCVTDLSGTSRPSQTPGRNMTDHIIQLCDDHYNILAKLSRTQHPDPAARLRYYFLLAVHLCHELAHVLASSRQNPYSGLEPILGTVNESECGRQWEVMVFGGIPYPINNRADCAHGLAICSWPMNVIDNWDGIWYSIPHEYIQNLFSAQWWVGTIRAVTSNDTEFLHVPRNGAQSAEVPVVETHCKTDEETRLKEEEFQETVAVGRAGENACLNDVAINTQPYSALAASLKLAREREAEAKQLSEIKEKQEELRKKLQQARETFDQEYPKIAILESPELTEQHSEMKRPDILSALDSQDSAKYLPTVSQDSADRLTPVSQNSVDRLPTVSPISPEMYSPALSISSKMSEMTNIWYGDRSLERGEW